MSTDPEHKFDLALQLGEVQIAYQLALEAEVRAHIYDELTSYQSFTVLTVLDSIP